MSTNFDKITFVNGQQPAINDTNLNAIQSNVETSINSLDNTIKALVPAGAIMQWGAAQPPNGWLICNGDAISRETYADLFSAISTIYGTGDGSTTFNLPNFKGKVPVCMDGDQTEFNILGKTGGEKTVTLTVNQIPSHYHTQSLVGGSSGNPGNKAAFTWSQPTNQYDYSGTDLAQRTGGGQAHNNLQPYITINYIIKY